MRTSLPFLAAILLFAPLLPLRAGDTSTPPDTSAASIPADSTPAPGNLKTSYEFDAETSYVGSARTHFGDDGTGNVSEQTDSSRLLIEPQFNDGPIYRFGLAYERYNFGLSKAAPIPNILQAENVVVGMDFELFNSWLVRVEADPGLYGDARDTGFRTFNAPFSIGGSYIASETVQYIAGLEVDFNRQIPVIPAVGIHWSLNDNWVLDAVLPTPRIEYDYDKNLTLFLGGDFDDGTYRLDRVFAGDYGVAKPSTVAEGKHTGPNLNNAIVEYDEVRVGVGFSWKATKAITFELEAGYLPYREFDFHRADVHFSNDDGAAYGRMSFNAQF